MKKSLFTALVLMTLSLGASANNGTDKGKTSDSTPVKVKSDNESNGAENIIWTSSSRFKKATSTNEGVTTTAFYTWQNELVATTQIVEIKDLDPKAIKGLIKYYPNYQMGEIIKYSGNEVAYFVNLKNDKENFLVKITPDMNVGFFKNVSL